MLERKDAINEGGSRTNYVRSSIPHCNSLRSVFDEKLNTPFTEPTSFITVCARNSHFNLP